MNYFHFDNEVESKADKSQSKYSAGFPEHFVFAKWNKFLGMWFREELICNIIENQLRGGVEFEEF